MEIEHTADWALKVWAPDAASLLAEAGRGMFALMGAQIKPLSPHEHQLRQVHISAADLESLLVSFLSELLYLSEQEGLGFDDIQVVLQHRADQGFDLKAVLRGGLLLHQDKEIKAVTYHNLKVLHTPRGLEATIVFDV